MKRPLIDLLVMGLANAKEDRVDVQLGEGIWLTVHDDDLSRRPVVGDVLRIQQPVAVALNPEETNDEH